MLVKARLRIPVTSGFTLIEVLITIIVIALGLLGLAGLVMKMDSTQLESYQRAQAVLLLEDMANRIESNRAAAGSYVAVPASPLGTGDTQPADCTGLAIGANRDQCEWSNALKGAAEQLQGGGKVGAMLGARGCVEQLVVADPTPGICTAGVYRVTVAWQGNGPTFANPNLLCGKGLYGSDDAYRRIISTQVVIGLPTC